MIEYFKIKHSLYLRFKIRKESEEINSAKLITSSIFKIYKYILNNILTTRFTFLQDIHLVVNILLLVIFFYLII